MKKIIFYLPLMILLSIPNTLIAKEDCSKITSFKKKLECKIKNNPLNQSKLKKSYAKKHKELENKTLMDIFKKKEK
jgi:hypothetical protein|tara:strand:+ start:485 stop:712 length:228 start_codon:yes stop_codon:yes gene_type:complete